MPTPESPIPRLRDLQFRVEYILLRGIIGLVRLFPLDRAAGMSARTWKILAPLIARKRHNRALDNIAIAFPEMPDAERRRIVAGHWGNLGRIMVETMQLDRLTSDPGRIEIASAKVLSRYQDKLGPAIGISLHMGNWELAIWPLTAAKANPAAVYRSVNNPYVDDYLRAQRATLYPGGLFGRGKVEGNHGDDQRTARAITDFVRNGGRLGMVCDLYDRTGIPVPFFGKPARTQAIGAMIARRLGTRIWLSRCTRIANQSRFRIEILELKVPRTENRSADITAIMTAMQEQFEAWIKEHPEQWMWSNRRWS
jgi:Kdo2-lipid IVA lauroyltransferase/acyltransferase